MRKRYCDTKLEQLQPCNVGWCCYPPNDSGSSSCTEEPMEQNCHNIIDTRYMKCPYCGSDIGEVDDSIELELAHRKMG